MNGQVLRAGVGRVGNVGSAAVLAAGLAGAGVIAGSAEGAFLPSGEYFLANHPDGREGPPGYGLRLDELYDATPGDSGYLPDGLTPAANHDVFSFDFDHAMSDVRLAVTPTTLRIFGTVVGGRDVGNNYAADAYFGLYTIDFLYNIGVGDVPGDDDTWVMTANHANSGTIVTPLSDTINLVDELSMGSPMFSLRIGNGDDDTGYRGFTGASGWGWVSYAGPPVRHVGGSDWLFTVLGPTPTPGTAVVAVLGAGVIGARRQRRSTR